MIEWIEYDSNSREIESHKDHLITDGRHVWIAHHAKLLNATGYGWHDRYTGKPLLLPVTHLSKINLPAEEMK
ncbi:hypothetical protein [Paenibacillus harenae]|uniref:hypothetical protein n=1 Tax=Paenibacillus harenae TaxID=306543 RepID=UPI00048CFA63|nr:hypothetical protein [Paenibacillus harenae]